ncbi:hypothetical protein MXL46_17965 [Heyndrickxia sporothermodurans]|uniref:Uncharacterized protein n=1 Tax=Heyndrickxia vini TaxID=1476025 RepID=A0ABX7E382_9BACI|nr:MULTISPECIES: hypothetical protein [Heyndrickxia]MEB6550947.1 hypothetical protein [Heyndrickxia sporothermodurans]QQZ09739.1 hypothetical protein I5776_01795 [Heyndrickxia vini]
MGQSAVLKIKDFSDTNSVIQPILMVSEEREALRLSEVVEMFEQRFQHEKHCCNSSSEPIEHL